MIELNKIYNADCFEILKDIDDNSIDAIIVDPPFETTRSDVDKYSLDWDLLWQEYKRVIKSNRAIVIFAQQPFTTRLISSNIDMWKYNWVWEKDNATNFLNSHYQPMKITEDICVFGDGATSNSPNPNLFYNPQFTEGKPYSCVSGSQKKTTAVAAHGSRDVGGFKTENDGKRYPKNLIKFNRDKDKIHPTQKPTALLEYLIKTYSNENDLILDSCSGSGSLAIACMNTKRNFICIEKDENYYNLSMERLKKFKVKKRLF